MEDSPELIEYYKAEHEYYRERNSHSREVWESTKTELDAARSVRDTHVWRISRRNAVAIIFLLLWSDYIRLREYALWYPGSAFFQGVWSLLAILSVMILVFTINEIGTFKKNFKIAKEAREQERFWHKEHNQRNQESLRIEFLRNSSKGKP